MYQGDGWEQASHFYANLKFWVDEGGALSIQPPGATDSAF